MSSSPPALSSSSTPPPPAPSPALLLSAIAKVDVCIAVMTGPELRYTLVNPAFQAIAPAVPMLGRRYREIFPEAAASGSEARFLQVLETGEPWRMAEHLAPVPGRPDAVWEGEAVRSQAPGQEASVMVFAQDITERVRMRDALARSQQALQQANHKLQATIDGITDGVIVLDRDWRYTFVSERAGQIVGMRPAELLGGHVWDLFPEARRTRFHAGFQRAMNSGRPVHFEEYYPAPLGMWLECHCYPSEHELTVYFRNVTERRRAEESLRESTALLRAISDTSPDVIFAKDAEGRMRFANPATLALIGKDLADILGRTDAELLADQEAARLVMANDRRIMAQGEPEELEERVPLPDGTERIWLSRKTPYRNEAGRVVGLLGISRDITERKVAEDEIRRARDASERIIASITDGLAVLDRDWNYTYFSETGARMLGLRREDVVGKCMWDLYPHAETSRFGIEYRRAADSGKPVHFEEFYPEPLNRWLECHCYPSPDGLSVYFRDVTERRQAADALAEGERRLRESDRRKSEFLAVLSHELRNPLAPISNGLHLLERAAPGSPQAQKAMQVIRRQTTHLMRLVDDLLDITRISSGKIALQLAPLDLRELARRTAEDLQSLAAASGVALGVEEGAQPLAVHADAARLAQVIGNLVGNAIKFTPRGGSVRVRLASDDGHAQVQVIDDGMGIEPAIIDTMFEPFAQAEQNLARSRGGLGLGLAIVKALVGMHGGTVSALSEGPGRGAEFTVRLPLALPAQAADAAVPLAIPVAGRRVLIVEDNEDAGGTLAELLALDGHTVEVAAGGRAGLARAETFRPDVILCDIGLPDLDGYAFARAARGNPLLATSRLVALSGYALPEDRAKAHAAGFDGHFAKPPDLQLLRAMLSEAR